MLGYVGKTGRVDFETAAIATALRVATFGNINSKNEGGNQLAKTKTQAQTADTAMAALIAAADALVEPALDAVLAIAPANISTGAFTTALTNLENAQALCSRLRTQRRLLLSTYQLTIDAP